MDIKSYLETRRRHVEAALAELLPPADGPFAEHVKAMRYSIDAGGKRLRPILCLAGAEAVGADQAALARVLPVACALECIHTYSLIHDDLPAMDDDALRRGKPTNHVVFGEAAAILAGDGLLTLAFELLAAPGVNDLDPAARLRIIHVIAAAAGPLGMVGGQALDVANEGQDHGFELLRTIHAAKTGRLITASVVTGALAAGADEELIAALSAYGRAVGLAFQIVDDLLNATSTTEQLGKAAGSDAARGKATYPAFFGIEATRTRAAQAVDQALAALTGVGDRAEPLRTLARYIITRTR